jgi:hypothetical protein
MSITLRKETLQKYMNPVFLETGTFKGGGVRLALECGFKQILSIEVDPTLYGNCEREFVNNDNVVIVLGDSVKVLPSLLTLSVNPITFWLDAHIQESAVIGTYPVPLIQELTLIARHRQGKQDTVMIDDRRLFGQGTYWQGIKEADIIKLLEEAFPTNKIVFEDSNAAAQDIVVSTPAS